MNAGLKGSKINPYKNKSTEIEGEIDKTLHELTNLLTQIQASPEITHQMVTALENRLKTFNWDNPTPHDYIMEKADLAELLMVDKMNQNAGLRAIVSGAWLDSSGRQLIEDAFAFSTDKIDIPFQHGKLSFSIKIDGKDQGDKSATSIKDFLDQIDTLNGTDFKVTLSNGLYDALREGAALTGQAKSGLAGQNIINKNISKTGKETRDSVTLEQVGFNPMMLWQLYQLDLASSVQFFKPKGQQYSETLSDLANYRLSVSIGETALARNQVYLTEDGFITASQWMEKYQKYLIFIPDIVSIGPDFLTAPRTYYFNE